ncbi:MAG: leucyl aminopeptidase [Chitinophagales bacterium]|nr:leucyl aminopeptidase [Chitinophagales bacterium]
MSANLIKTNTDKSSFIAVLVRTAEDTAHPLLQPLKKIITQKMGDKENGIVTFYEDGYVLAALLLKETAGKSAWDMLEEARQKGGNVAKKINNEKCNTVLLLRASDTISKEELMACAEGISLSNYQFNKYKKEGKQNALTDIHLNDAHVTQEELDELKNVIDANELAKNLANEPVNGLNALQLSEKIVALGKELKFKTQILHKEEIKKLSMGGLIGVNMGSSVPPTFNILEYNPGNAKNKKPLVIIGKGVMYDTGGYSLKPPQGMASMKGDMSGAAAVIGTFYAVVKNKLPVHLIGLIPSTDNKINSDAMVPDDVIVMHDGTTVEILNTDAEGRLILGDALSYAKQYDPALVIDLATLTGAAAVITGSLGSAIMGTDTAYRNDLLMSGEMTHERLAEIPYWKEYGEMIKSDVADIKNIGGMVGGSATAGKFLEHFTDYPWLHLDIAGPAILKEDEAYKQKGASGIGVRLLHAFVKRFIEEPERNA